MSVIEAASVKVGTMADGTLRITVDIEPRFAQAAFTLFGAPGTAMALAALKPVAQQEKAKGGELSILAGKWCKDEQFQAWCGTLGSDGAAQAAVWMRDVCEVESRAELDHDKGAAERFQAYVRLPYMRHLEELTERADRRQVT